MFDWRNYQKFVLYSFWSEKSELHVITFFFKNNLLSI